MIVSSPENLRRTREQSFTVQGIKTRHRRRAEGIRPGDRILYYVIGGMGFAATATVTGSMFEERSRIWTSSRRDEVYPWRIRIRPDHVLEEGHWVQAKDLAFRLEYVKRWPPEHWPLAFQGHLHELPKVDFQLIENEILRVKRRQPGAAARLPAAGARSEPVPLQPAPAVPVPAPAAEGPGPEPEAEVLEAIGE